MGFGFNTTKGLVGEDVSVQSVEDEKLQNAMAMLPLVGRFRQGYELYRELNLASGPLRNGTQPTALI